MPIPQQLLPRFRPKVQHRPLAARAPGGPSLRVRWLGTAGHVISTDETTVLVDPFLTRPGLRGLLRPLEPDLDAIERWVPREVDAVLVGHSHYDHLLDAPAIVRSRAAILVGSGTTAAVARAAGVSPENIRVVPPGGLSLRVGDLEISFVPSLHGRIFLGKVPFPGEWTHAPPLPLYAPQYRMGGAYGILIRAGARTLYHNGSADLVDAEIAGRHADVVLAGLAGRKATRDYLTRLTGCLGPRVLVPTHHDAFFGPLELGERLLPGVDLDGFFRETRAVAPDARVVTPLYHDDVVIPLEGDPRDIAIVERTA